MKNLEILKEPYTDEKLEYNENTGRYQLTVSYMKSLREGESVPYRNDEIAKRRLREISQTIYSYLITHSNTANRQVIYFLLNKTENGRRFLIDVLSTQLESDLEFATNDIGKIALVNSQTGQVGDRDVYRQNLISIATENIIDDSVGYFGVNLCCMMPFDYYWFDLVRRYEGV